MKYSFIVVLITNLLFGCNKSTFNCDCEVFIRNQYNQQIYYGSTSSQIKANKTKAYHQCTDKNTDENIPSSVTYCELK